MRTIGWIGMLTVMSAAPAASQQALTATQFRGTHWLVGEWKGSGGAYPAFYEDYRLVNDSTIRQRSFTDSTFTTVSEESDIVYSGGAIRKSRGGTVRSVVARISGDTIRFEPATGSRGGFTWIRVSADAWVAILDASAPGREPVTYRLGRVRRP